MSRVITRVKEAEVSTMKERLRAKELTIDQLRQEIVSPELLLVLYPAFDVFPGHRVLSEVVGRHLRSSGVIPSHQRLGAALQQELASGKTLVRAKNEQIAKLHGIKDESGLGGP